ncbi:MAG: hypothetical protein EXR86_10080 [Gammaproteobacteria bacterium]|nr:hypothetical protein [Gammaproteobacteria bacterium]
MKVAIYFGVEGIRCIEIAMPEIQAPHKILMKVNAMSIRDSDLHPYRDALDPIIVEGTFQTEHKWSARSSNAEVMRARPNKASA